MWLCWEKEKEWKKMHEKLNKVSKAKLTSKIIKNRD